MLIFSNNFNILKPFIKKMTFTQCVFLANKKLQILSQQREVVVFEYVC